MPEANKEFELRQLLKAYRKGLISDELFEEQMREIDQNESPGASRSKPPARTYRVRDRIFATEREMLLCFLDEFRAGEAFGGVVLSLWAEVAEGASVRGGLRTICEREAMHGRLLGARLQEIGGQPTASLPESFRQAARARLASREVSDADKIGDFLRRIPDEESAVGPIREVLAQVEEDAETRAILETILEDELATIRWFHATGRALGVAAPPLGGNSGSRAGARTPPPS
jgi:hypothetical protein